MATVEAGGLAIGELSALLRAVDPRVVLVPPRVLRRIIKGVAGLGRLAWRIPHRGGFATDAASALAYADREELGLAPDEPVAGSLIILAGPDLDRLEDLPRADVLERYWREIFHARVHLAYDEQTDRFPPGGAWIDDRVARLGKAGFAEARAVLIEDHYLIPPADDRATLVEFAAVYLELEAFHPELIPHSFPAIDDHESIRSMLRADVDPDALLESTRPPGAADPATAPPVPPEDEAEVEEWSEPARPDPKRWTRLKAEADRRSEAGNHVRAAILRVIASGSAPAVEGPRTRAGAKSELDKLVRRLRSALGFDADEARLWRKALPPFLEKAARGLWPREARLLYDLQMVCSDHERSIYAVDLVGSALTLGRRPLKRPLPDQREVLILKHLRTARGRLARMRGPEPARGGLESLVGTAIARQEGVVRLRFRDRIGEVFDRVALRPTNLTERAARRKLVEELLDLVVERGFLRIGDLRDAVSRNQVKLHDLSRPGEFFRGDPLLRADDELARALDGVYHRGEVYLRALQRGSSLAFGTRVGRFLSRFVALPFGGAFVALEGLQHLVGPVVHMIGKVKPEILNPVSFLGLAAVLMGAINSSRFRESLLGLLRGAALLFRALLVNPVRWSLRLPLIRSVVNTRTFLLAWNWLVKPIAGLWLLSLFLTILARPGTTGLAIRVAVGVALALILNSRPGRIFEEVAADGASRVGLRVWRDLLPSLFRGIMDFFAAGLEMVERMIYVVDEWLRYRSGEGPTRLATKAVLGVFWGLVTYLIRIYINLLIEPQINPIKHFPVVTVSHKIILPMSGTFLALFKVPFLPLGEVLATTIASAHIFLLPGVFGFLVWELKENWRLYAANRPLTLRPVPIGHHGETVSRFLRRGFHSGTVPKLFAKLRKADHRAELGRGAGPATAVEGSLHHVEEAVRHLVDRGVTYLFEESRSLAPSLPTAGHVSCSTNRIVVELRDRDDAATAARIAFEEAGGRLTVHLDEPGWLAHLAADHRLALTNALAGLYAMGDVDVATSPGRDVAINLRLRPIAWCDWVAFWEDEAAGRRPPTPMLDGFLLPPTSPIIVPSPRR